MKNNRLALRFALSFSALATLALLLKIAPAAETAASQSKQEIRVYEVFGMGCPACHGGLAKLVKKVEGVKETEVNWKEQWLKVTFVQAVEPEDEKIFQAIRKANFTPGKRLDNKTEGERK